MKQKSVLLVSLLVLILSGIYLAFFRNLNNYDEKMLISLRDTSNVSEIKIQKGDSILLFKKKEGKWKLNNVFQVNEHSIKRLLRIFKNIEINRLIAKAEHDSVINKLTNYGISLSFVNSENKQFEFWIGDFNETINATVLMTRDNLPVYATAPGLSNDLNKYVDIDPLYWRNKQLFVFEAENIKTINFTNISYPAYSFSIEYQNSEYKVFDNNKNLFKSETNKILRYLSYFKNIEFESIEKGLSLAQMDSVIKATPKFIIKIIGNAGPEFELKLLPIQIKNSENQFDLNKVYGYFNNQKPILIINYFAIDPIIKEIKYFQ